MLLSRKLQLAELDLLIELDRICREYNIKYFLIGGTLIGAVRHEGFIPWDDDIDVGMLRGDYIRFREVCEQELKDEYYMHDWEKDGCSPLPFTKLRIRNTRVVEDIARNSAAEQEIFIDVFPFDAAPEQFLQQKRQQIRTVLLKKELLIRCGYKMSEHRRGMRKYLNRMLYRMLDLIFLPYTTEELREKYEKESLRYANKKTGLCVNLGGAYSYGREMKKTSCFETCIPALFEGQYFWIPKEYDRYLREIYGDYRKLPDKKDRVPRHNIKIDLGSYRIKNVRYQQEIK